MPRPSPLAAPLTALLLASLFALPTGCVPQGGGGGGGDDPVVVGDGGPVGGEDGSATEPEPEPEGLPDPDPEPEPLPEDPVQPEIPVTGPQACIDADGEWPAEWKLFEDQVVELVNRRRAEGADCNSQGVWEPTHPLTSDEQLRCAARLHSRDMGQRGYFDHVDPEGVDPGVRIQAAEYGGFPGGENIAAGARTPEGVVQGWMDSDGHCSNIMRPGFDEIGVGFAEVPGSDWRIYWTQVFGSR